jgi:hypothetical protein
MPGNPENNGKLLVNAVIAEVESAGLYRFSDKPELGSIQLFRRKNAELLIHHLRTYNSDVNQRYQRICRPDLSADFVAAHPFVGQGRWTFFFRLFSGGLCGGQNRVAKTHGPVSHWN